MPTPYEIMYGHDPEKPEPKAFGVYRAIGEDVLGLREKYGYAVVRQVAILAQKNGLGDYLQYMFYVLDG